MAILQRRQWKDSRQTAPTSFSGTFQQAFSPGNFVDYSKGMRQTRTQKSSDENSLPEVPETAEGDTGVGVFQCPSEGCIKVYQRYSALEKYLSYEKCKLLPERATLLDQAKEMYHLKLTEGKSAGATSHDERTVTREASANTNQLATGWALKQTKNSGRLSESQKKYLNEKFSIGQQTGHKVDPLSVARDMRYARNAEGNRLFTKDEFLSEQQIQSYFHGKLGNYAINTQKMTVVIARLLSTNSNIGTLGQKFYEKFSSSILLLMTTLIFAPCIM